jgi:hypothetical protein
MLRMSVGLNLQPLHTLGALVVVVSYRLQRLKLILHLHLSAFLAWPLGNASVCQHSTSAALSSSEEELIQHKRTQLRHYQPHVGPAVAKQLCSSG